MLTKGVEKLKWSVFVPIFSFHSIRTSIEKTRHKDLTRNETRMNSNSYARTLGEYWWEKKYGMASFSSIQRDIRIVVFNLDGYSRSVLRLASFFSLRLTRSLPFKLWKLLQIKIQSWFQRNKKGSREPYLIILIEIFWTWLIGPGPALK